MTGETKIIGGILALTLAIIVGISVLGGKSAPPPIEGSKVEKGEAVRDDSHGLGKNDSKVTLVEFGDFQCPACGAAYPILKQVLAERGEKIRFVWRNFPIASIHSNADNAARAAEAANEQGKFWEMHDKLFANQTNWSGATKSKEVFAGFAKDLGLDAEMFSRDFEDQKIVNRIKQDLGDANALGVNSTPTFFMNGEKYSGETSVAAFEAKIDELLK